MLKRAIFTHVAQRYKRFEDLPSFGMPFTQPSTAEPVLHLLPEVSLQLHMQTENALLQHSLAMLMRCKSCVGTYICMYV